MFQNRLQCLTKPASQCTTSDRYNLELYNIFCKYYTDKAQHGYEDIYQPWCKTYPVKKMLEIGVRDGISIMSWLDFLPDTEIHGIDIKDYGYKPKSDRVKLFMADTTKTVPFEIQDEQYDMIVDDGLHIVGAQVETFKRYYPLLKPGGLYVVEDVHGIYKAKWFLDQVKDIINPDDVYLKESNAATQNHFGKFNYIMHLVAICITK